MSKWHDTSGPRPLPKKEKWYLVTIDGMTHITYFAPGSAYHIQYWTEKVAAWRKLPKPFTRGGEQE